MKQLLSFFLVLISLFAAASPNAESRLKFRVVLDENLLAFQILRGNRQAVSTPSRDIEDLRARMRLLHPQAVSQIENIADESFKVGSAHDGRFTDVIRELKQTDGFRQILEETKAHMNELKSWLQLLSDKDSAVADIAKSILKAPLRGDFTIYVLSPQYPQAYNFNDNTLAYGSRQFFDNHALVYLFHECLHSVLADGEINHAVIELAADYEFRKRLQIGFNESDTSLNFSVYSVGAPSRLTLRRSIYDRYWSEYLSSNETLVQFARRMARQNFE